MILFWTMSKWESSKDLGKAFVLLIQVPLVSPFPFLLPPVWKVDVRLGVEQPSCNHKIKSMKMKIYLLMIWKEEMEISFSKCFIEPLFKLWLAYLQASCYLRQINICLSHYWFSVLIAEYNPHLAPFYLITLGQKHLIHSNYILSLKPYLFLLLISDFPSMCYLKVYKTEGTILDHLQSQINGF